MNRRSQAIIGATVVALGIGVIALGAIDDESRVRYVEDILADPTGHTRGTYTVMGIPQPQRLEMQDADNPAWANVTTTVRAWSAGGQLHHSVLTLSVDGPDAAGRSHWTLRNETRVAGQPDTAFPPSEQTWTVEGPHRVFQVDSFLGGQRVWAVYHGVLRDPLQPKPSQLTGRVAADVPAGAVVYEVDTLTVGCSSKFLPAAVRDQYDTDGDGFTD